MDLSGTTSVEAAGCRQQACDSEVHTNLDPDSAVPHPRHPFLLPPSPRAPDHRARWAATITFLNDYLAQDKGLSVEDSTVVMTAYNLGVCAGILLGGWFGQVLYNLGPRFVPLLMGGSTLGGMIPLLWLIWLPYPVSFAWPFRLAFRPAIRILVFFGGGLSAALSP